MSRPHVRDTVERLLPYRGLAGERAPVSLDGNENPLGPSPAMLAALRDVTPELLSRYPATRELRDAWAKRLGVAPGQLLLTSGSGPALALVAELVLDPGDACVLLEPSFELYAGAANRRDARVCAVPLSEDLAFPTRAFRRALDTHDPRLVVLGYPDNPSGAAPTRRTLEAAVDRQPETLFLVDEAYVEFTGRSVLDLARTRRNVLVTRTFSKALGLAGERIGGIVGPPDLIERLGRINVPYPVTALGARLARAALDDEAHVRRTVRQVRRSKRQLVEGLAGTGLEVRDTAANFVLVRVGSGDRANALTEALAGRRVAVRDRSHLHQMNGIVRISAGTDAETDRCLDELRLLTADEPEALLFDMDGTLVDVSGSYDEAIWRTVRAFAPEGAALTRADVLAVKRDPQANDDIDATLLALKRLGVRISRGRVADRFQALYRGVNGRDGLAAREQWLVPRRTLDRLGRDRALAVVTGRPRDEAEMALDRAGTAACFAAVITADDTRRHKPDPAPVRRALRALGVRRAWMTGDSPADLRAARAAGVPAIGIARGDAALAAALRAERPLALLDAARDLDDVFRGRTALREAERTDA